jgi:hypothetical protein
MKKPSRTSSRPRKMVTPTAVRHESCPCPFCGACDVAIECGASNMIIDPPTITIRPHTETGWFSIYVNDEPWSAPVGYGSAWETAQEACEAFARANRQRKRAESSSEFVVSHGAWMSCRKCRAQGPVAVDDRLGDAELSAVARKLWYARTTK